MNVSAWTWSRSACDRTDWHAHTLMAHRTANGTLGFADADPTLVASSLHLLTASWNSCICTLETSRMQSRVLRHSCSVRLRNSSGLLDSPRRSASSSDSSVASILLVQHLAVLTS